MSTATLPVPGPFLILNGPNLIAMLREQGADFVAEYLSLRVAEERAKEIRRRLKSLWALECRWSRSRGREPSKERSILMLASHTPSRKRVLRGTLEWKRRWIAESEQRQSHARHAANCRWGKLSNIEHGSGSSIEHPENGAQKSPLEPPYVKLSNTSLIPSVGSPAHPSMLEKLESAFSTIADAVGMGFKGGFKRSDGLPVGRGKENRLAGHRDAITGGLKFDADPRFEGFKLEVFQFWAGVNPNLGSCPWIEADEKALVDFLRGCSIDLAGFKTMLANRAHSEIVYSDPPRRWLAELMAYAETPLDRFRKPLKVRQLY